MKKVFLKSSSESMVLMIIDNDCVIINKNNDISTNKKE